MQPDGTGTETPDTLRRAAVESGQYYTILEQKEVRSFMREDCFLPWFSQDDVVASSLTWKPTLCLALHTPTLSRLSVVLKKRRERRHRLPARYILKLADDRL